MWAMDAVDGSGIGVQFELSLKDLGSSGPIAWSMKVAEHRVRVKERFCVVEGRHGNVGDGAAVSDRKGDTKCLVGAAESGERGWHEVAAVLLA
jgi:hypothetical protein